MTDYSPPPFPQVSGDLVARALNDVSNINADTDAKTHARIAIKKCTAAHDFHRLGLLPDEEHVKYAAHAVSATTVLAAEMNLPLGPLGILDGLEARMTKMMEEKMEGLMAEIKDLKGEIDIVNGTLDIVNGKLDSVTISTANNAARIQNAQGRGISVPILPLTNNNGEVSIYFPKTTAALKQLKGSVLNDLLNHYNLTYSVKDIDDLKRDRFRRFVAAPFP